MVKEQGFSLTEMLIAATITLIVMAGALTSLHQTATINASSGLMSELEQNLRAGINLMVDDFLKAGWKIPIGGIPLPSGAGAGNVVRPGPLNQTLTFNGILVLSSINPGAGLGLPVGGRRI
jgi:prepilin-type N-terminal cleavage/methylation domain-containing protein